MLEAGLKSGPTALAELQAAMSVIAAVKKGRMAAELHHADLEERFRCHLNNFTQPSPYQAWVASYKSR